MNTLLSLNFDISLNLNLSYNLNEYPFDRKCINNHMCCIIQFIRHLYFESQTQNNEFKIQHRLDSVRSSQNLDHDEVISRMLL